MRASINQFECVKSLFKSIIKSILDSRIGLHAVPLGLVIVMHRKLIGLKYIIHSVAATDPPSRFDVRSTIGCQSTCAYIFIIYRIGVRTPVKSV